MKDVMGEFKRLEELFLRELEIRGVQEPDLNLVLFTTSLTLRPYEIKLKAKHVKNEAVAEMFFQNETIEANKCYTEIERGAIEFVKALPPREGGSISNVMVKAFSMPLNSMNGSITDDPENFYDDDDDELYQNPSGMFKLRTNPPQKAKTFESPTHNLRPDGRVRRKVRIEKAPTE